MYPSTNEQEGKVTCRKLEMASVLPVRKATDMLKHDLPKHVESSSQLGLESRHTQEARPG